MRVEQMARADVNARLADAGLMIDVGGFGVMVRSSIAAVAEGLVGLYGSHPVLSSRERLIDFNVELRAVGGLRRWVRPQVQFLLDGRSPFKPLPRDQAFAMFEWGLNWCVANNVLDYLVIHAAVVEKVGRAVLLPGLSGSGKSTLCAELVCRGWRLLSDEMAMISLADGALRPVPRPISLKNASIDLMRSAHPDAVFGEVVRDTIKGTVGHMRAPAQSVARASEPVRPALILFPTYAQGAGFVERTVSPGHAFMKLASNTFNYDALGKPGFFAMGQLVADCPAVEATYASFDPVIESIERAVLAH